MQLVLSCLQPLIGLKKLSLIFLKIDIFLNDREIWKYENFESKIFHIPGHTSGHICYNFFKDKLLFTGDTLFSLGCGRIFEGTYEQMFNSLNLLKTFPIPLSALPIPAITKLSF